MLIAPLFWRSDAASPTLAIGALCVCAVAVAGLIRVDPRIGLAAMNSNRGEYLYCLALQLPVLALALLSWRRFKWAFWVGWGINVAFTLSVLVVVVWLEFFWHW